MRGRFRSPSVIARVAVAIVASGTPAFAQVLREQDFGVGQDDHFGQSCANVGDVDGDGVDDFVVGSPFFDSGGLISNGRAVVYSGASGSKIREHAGQKDDDKLGWCVAGAGDVDSDRYDDYVVSAPNHDTATLFSAGMVVVYSGKTGSTIWSKSGSTGGGYYGSAVSGIGDGTGEVVIGNWNDEAFVVSSTGRPLYHLTDNSQFGTAVSGCGDLDADGVADFLVGKPLADRAFPFKQHVGAVFVYSGATGAWIRTIHGTNPGDNLGTSLARLGDVDGDQVDDFIAGGKTSDANGTDSGIVRVVSGATGATIHEQPGDASGERHGYSVCGVGDVDRDGIPDYSVGAPEAGSGANGRVRVCSGADGSTIYEWYGGRTNDQYGSAVAGGDWNDDGVGDVLAADEGGYDSSNVQTGSVDVWLMCPAWWTNYGTGWTGKNGIPSLVSVQNPEVGAPIDLKLSNSLGASTTALLFVGLQPTSIHLNNSGTLLVLPFLTLVLPVPVGGLTLSDALPNDPALDFLDLYLQAIEFDGFATKGFSFTPGLQLHCGVDWP